MRASEPVRAASLLSGEEGLTPLILHGERLSVPRTVALLARGSGTELDTRRLGKVRQWRGGTVADVPSDFVAALVAASPLDGQVEVQVAEELPELFEQPVRERRDSGSYGRGPRDDRGSEGGYRGRSSGGYQGNRGQGGRSQDGRGESRGGGRWSSQGGQGQGSAPRRTREDFSDREFVPSGR